VDNSPDFSKINYIIFDWDGTLIDSMDFYAEAFAKVVLDEFGADIKKAKDFYISLAGTTLSSEMRIAAKKFGQREIKDTLYLENKFWQILKESLSTKLISQAKETLEELKFKGKKLIIWSGTKTEVLKDQIKRLGISKLIDFYIGTKSGTNQATKGPDFFKIIAEYFKINVEDLRDQAIVVGDGPGDMEAAKKCDVFAIGVLKTTSRENLENAGANLIIEKISDLSNLM